jgi:peptidoglycan/LPS O-acetylase OafA/YrhL
VFEKEFPWETSPKRQQTKSAGCENEIPALCHLFCHMAAAGSTVIFLQARIMSTPQEPRLSPSTGSISPLPVSVVVPTFKNSRQAAVWAWLLQRLSRETSSGRFIPEMDGLRFVAITMVVLFHLNGYLLAKSSSEPDWLAQIASVGFRGVELFFVISGFILGLPFAAHYLKNGATVNLRKYYRRRLTRLEPPYFVTVLLLFVLALWFQGKSGMALYPHLAASLFYLHNLIYGFASPAIGVAWSLEIEVQFYVLAPFLAIIFAIRERWLRRGFMVVFILGILSAQSVFLPQQGRLSLSILAYLQFFLIGFLLADVFLADWKEGPQANFYWDIVAIIGWPLLFIALREEVLTHWLFPFLVFLLFCAAFRGSWSRQIVSHPLLTIVGGMCYSIYLIHYEVISALGRLTKGVAAGWPYWAYFVVQFSLIGIAILFVCGVYFLLLEKPCMSRDWPQRVWGFWPRKAYITSGVSESAAAD